MRQDALFMDNNALLGELKLPELRIPEWQADQGAQTRQRATSSRTAAARSTRTRSTARTSQTGSRTSPGNAQTGSQNRTASQPVLDFRGSDYEGALPPAAPPETLELEAGLPATDPTLPGQPSGTGPASRNTRSNPILPDDEFILELPDYNPLLE
jgi:hypothetical protein